MSWFQLIATVVTGTLFLHAVYRLVRGRPPKGLSLAAATVWFLSTLFILMPELTMRVAALLGIGRGADLVLYVFVIFFILVSFYFYGRFRTLESQMTEVVRHVALANQETTAKNEARTPEDATTHRDAS